MGESDTSKQIILAFRNTPPEIPKLTFLFKASTTAVNANVQFAKPVFRLNQWHHVVITHGTGAIKLYINSTLAETSTITYNSIPSTASRTLGTLGGHLDSTHTSANSLRGSLGDFTIYTTELSADQVKNIYTLRNLYSSSVYAMPAPAPSRRMSRVCDCERGFAYTGGVCAMVPGAPGCVGWKMYPCSPGYYLANQNSVACSVYLTES
jgi:hypothetical protein